MGGRSTPIPFFIYMSYSSIKIPRSWNKTFNLISDSYVPSGGLVSIFDVIESWNTTYGGSLPSQSGNNGKFLTTDGTSASWATVALSPAGLNTQVQFNNAGVFGASALLTWSGTGLSVATPTSLGAFITGGASSPASGEVLAFSTNTSFAPTSGTATYNGLKISPTIDQTGGASGITRGIFIDPTITAAANFIAIETTNGKIGFGTNTFYGGTQAVISRPTSGIVLNLTASTGSNGNFSFGMDSTESYMQNSIRPLSFYSTSTRVLTIANTNRVGIGDILAPAARLDIAGEILSGATSTSTLKLAQTWNTTGTPTCILLDVTDTASHADSLLLHFRVSTFSRFSVNKNGGVLSQYALFGTGTPEGVVTAPVGALFSRTDGGAGTTLYVKESGAGNTGWVAK